MIAAPLSLIKTILAVEALYPVTILPVDINGNRWAFSGKNVGYDMRIASSHRIRINDTVGAIAYNWAALSPDAQRAIEEQLRNSL